MRHHFRSCNLVQSKNHWRCPPSPPHTATFSNGFVVDVVSSKIKKTPAKKKRIALKINGKICPKKKTTNINKFTEISNFLFSAFFSSSLSVLRWCVPLSHASALSSNKRPKNNDAITAFRMFLPPPYASFLLFSSLVAGFVCMFFFLVFEIHFCLRDSMRSPAFYVILSGAGCLGY